MSRFEKFKNKDIFDKLKNKNFNIDIFDPLAEQKEIKYLYGKNKVSKFFPNKYDGIIIGVGHDEFKLMGINFIKSYVNPTT